jgi:5-oxoprolinase (ATP-hydrolysing)
VISVQDDGRGIRIEDAWGVPAGFFSGFSVLVADDATCVISVLSSLSENGGLLLLLDQEAPDSWVPGAMVELFTGEEAPVMGARLLTATRPGGAFPEMRFRLATTRATNALLERKGSPVALIVTRGFGDLLEIGDQRRADLFALRHEPRTRFHTIVREVDERLDQDGCVLKAPDENEVRKMARELFAGGLRHAAVALLHSHANNTHEKMIGRVLLECGFEHVSLSSEIASFTKILPRAQSAVANAYLTGPVSAFLKGVSAPLKVTGESAMQVLTSAGGLVPADSVRPKDMLLSGPAGGVIGAANAAARVGCARVITFDMGGTSTDVSRIDGRPGYRFSQQIEGMSLLSPCVAVETVAAGGGSICRWTSSGLEVGPQSAGSDPGPACYGRGGPLTITDVNLLLGRFDASKASIPLFEEAARERLRELCETIYQSSGNNMSEEEVLRGCLQLAVDHMADAIRRISVAEGCDPAAYALLAFGGAGPQHACDLADRLGIRTILVPGHAGILSAVGLDQAVPERFVSRQVLRTLTLALPDLNLWLDEMQAEAKLAFDPADGADFDAPHVLAELRLKGQDTPLQIQVNDVATIHDDYRSAYERLFGYKPPLRREVELVSLRVAIRLRRDVPAAIKMDDCGMTPGPRLIQDDFSTLVVTDGWEVARVSDFGHVMKRRKVSQTLRGSLSDSALSLVLGRHRFHAIVEEMGALLRRTAISTNIRERLDFSCALLDPEGRLITSAPHIPVHLGALGVCVRETMRHLSPRHGDTWITNHPAFGGSHLPDITLITPVFDERETLLGFVANRAHHAEIGGITPGSMPANASCLADEGTVIAPRYLIKEGQSRFHEVESLLLSGPHPTRNLPDNIADLHAQLAANLMGAERLRALAAGDPERVRQIMQGTLADSARVMRDHIALLAEGHAEERMDDGTIIQVRIQKPATNVCRLDFTGSSPPHAGNLNATRAIVQSAVLYVLRLLLQRDLPLNEGLLEPVEIILPPSLLNPCFSGDATSDPAVVGGNVEVSQRLVDTLIKAFRLQACSQGTMNNLLFGNQSFGYYETIAGGAGAGKGYDGASALHTHMTNTAITDPEIIEQRYPVRLREFSIRHGSGGRGEWNGGDGVVREFEFLSSLTVSLLTQHRTSGPYGMEGGDEGRPGRQIWKRADGVELELPSATSIQVTTGDRLRIETPGGGGFGSLNARV